jgi:hypothetical protein
MDWPGNLMGFRRLASGQFVGVLVPAQEWDGVAGCGLLIRGCQFGAGTSFGLQFPSFVVGKQGSRPRNADGLLGVSNLEFGDV